MAKRLSEPNLNENESNKKPKINVDIDTHINIVNQDSEDDKCAFISNGYEEWMKIVEYTREIFNDKREEIKKKYQDTDFENKLGIDRRIYYGGVNGNEAFQEMFNVIIKHEMQIFFRMIIRATKSNSHLPLTKFPICYSLFNLVGMERNDIAELTQTFKSEDFGMFAHDTKKYHYIYDEISAWPAWHSAFLKQLKNIFTTYQWSEQQYCDLTQIKYLLKNNDKTITFIVKHETENKYKCYLMAGDKNIIDHKNANLSSAMLVWTCYADNMLNIYPSIIRHINEWDLIDIQTDEQKSKFFVPVNPFCFHKAYYEPIKKIFDPLFSAILWNATERVDTFNDCSYFVGDIMRDQHALVCLHMDDFEHDFVNAKL